MFIHRIRRNWSEPLLRCTLFVLLPVLQISLPIFTESYKIHLFNYLELYLKLGFSIFIHFVNMMVRRLHIHEYLCTIFIITFLDTKDSELQYKMKTPVRSVLPNKITFTIYDNRVMEVKMCHVLLILQVNCHNFYRKLSFEE